MNSRERVYAALRKEPADRVPIALFLHPETKQIISEEFEIQEEDVDYLLGNDIRQMWVNNNYAMEGVIHDHEGDMHTDSWGIRWKRMGGFNQIISYPYADKKISEITRESFPYNEIDTLFKPMDELVEMAEGYFLGCDVSPCAFEMYCRLRGLEQGLFDIALEPGQVEKAIAECIDFSLYLSRYALQRYSLDWLWTGDDVASQQAMMMNPDTWRDLIKPGMKRLFKTAKDKNIYTAYHCCGALRDIIPDLIEIGLDVLHPIQPNSRGMNPEELKKEFGSDLAFIGGLDTQWLIPYGTPHEVKKQTEQLIGAMTTDGGGYILAASHTVPPETPIENIIAIYEAMGMTKEFLYDTAADMRKQFHNRI